MYEFISVSLRFSAVNASVNLKIRATYSVIFVYVHTQLRKSRTNRYKRHWIVSFCSYNKLTYIAWVFLRTYAVSTHADTVKNRHM